MTWAGGGRSAADWKCGSSRAGTTCCSRRSWPVSPRSYATVSVYMDNLNRIQPFLFLKKCASWFDFLVSGETTVTPPRSLTPTSGTGQVKVQCVDSHYQGLAQDGLRGGDRLRPEERRRNNFRIWGIARDRDMPLTSP